MEEDIDDLIAEIARKNGIAVDKTDPILMMHTVNQRLLKQSSDAQEALLAEFKSEMELVAFKWGEDAKDKAQRILTAALASSRDAMTKVMDESSKATAEAVSIEVENAIRKITGKLAESRTIARTNLFAAALTLCASIVALIAILQ